MLETLSEIVKNYEAEVRLRIDIRVLAFKTDLKICFEYCLKYVNILKTCQRAKSRAKNPQRVKDFKIAKFVIKTLKILLNS